MVEQKVLPHFTDASRHDVDRTVADLNASTNPHPRSSLQCPYCNSTGMCKDCFRKLSNRSKSHRARGNKDKPCRVSVRYVANGTGARATLKMANNLGQGFLEKELRKLQRRTGTGYELEMKWLPGKPEYHNERKLAEEVRGNTIIIYTENPRKAMELLRHGFMEWLMNGHTKPYREMVNGLIRVFEALQYENKEKTIEILERLL